MIRAHSLFQAARDVAVQVDPVETAIDDSLSRAARLLATMPEARRSAGLPAQTGHAAMMKVAATVAALAQARDEMLAAHHELSAARDDLHIPEIAFGSAQGCPSEAKLTVAA